MGRAVGASSRESRWFASGMDGYAEPNCIGTKHMASEKEEVKRRRHLD